MFFPKNIKDINYFIHNEPQYTETNKTDYNLTKNKNFINIKKEVEKNELIELNSLIPKNFFKDSNHFYDSKNKTIKDALENEQKYQKKKELEKKLIPIFKSYLRPFIIFILPILYIFFIWYFVSRSRINKKDLNYFNTYEREVPYNHDAITANYYLKGKLSKRWFATLLLQLIHKRIFNLKKINDNLYLVNENKDINNYNLEIYEKKIYDFIIKKMNKENKIKLSKLKWKIKFSISFKELQKDIFYNYKNEFSKKLDKKGYNLVFSGFVFIILLMILLNIIFNSSSKLIEIVISSFYFSILFYFFLILLIFIYSKISHKSLVLMFSKWKKPEYKLYNLKWKNYKKYITDFSYMKNHPPRSIVLWENYLIYATAFGTAKKTSKILKANNLYDDHNLFINYTILYTSYSTGFRTAGSSMSGSGAGSGGFGGGGAGAR